MLFMKKKLNKELYQEKNIDKLYSMITKETAKNPSLFKNMNDYLKEPVIDSKEKVTKILENEVKPIFYDLTGIDFDKKSNVYMSNGSELTDTLKIDLPQIATRAAGFEYLRKLITKDPKISVGFLALYLGTEIYQSYRFRKGAHGITEKKHMYFKPLPKPLMNYVIAHEFTHYVRKNLSGFKFYFSSHLLEEGIAEMVASKITEKMNCDLTKRMGLERKVCNLESSYIDLLRFFDPTNPLYRDTAKEMQKQGKMTPMNYANGLAIFALAEKKHGESVIKEAMKEDYTLLLE